VYATFSGAYAIFLSWLYCIFMYICVCIKLFWHFCKKLLCWLAASTFVTKRERVLGHHLVYVQNQYRIIAEQIFVWLICFVLCFTFCREVCRMLANAQQKATIWCCLKFKCTTDSSWGTTDSSWGRNEKQKPKHTRTQQLPEISVWKDCCRTLTCYNYKCYTENKDRQKTKY